MSKKCLILGPGLATPDQALKKKSTILGLGLPTPNQENRGKNHLVWGCQPEPNNGIHQQLESTTLGGEMTQRRCDAYVACQRSVNGNKFEGGWSFELNFKNVFIQKIVLL